MTDVWVESNRASGIYINEDWAYKFLDLAKLVSTWSKDPSTKTGAVIVESKNKLISVGFNGFPKYMPDNPEYYDDRNEKYSRIIHCEMNALLFAGNMESIYEHTLYTYPFISCDRCFVHMVQAGINVFIAPKPTADQLTRWGESFERTKKYANECEVDIVELEYE